MTNSQPITYAEKTTVAPEKTAGEIEALVNKYGATKYAYMKDDAGVVIGFVMKNRQVRFYLKIPLESAYHKDHNGRARTAIQRQNAHQQAVRSLWRSLLLCIKSKLESVSAGIETFEESFLAQIVLPNNQRVGDWAVPQIESAYKSGEMPPMLPSGE